MSGTLSAFIASVIVLFGDILLINANDSFYCHLIKVFWISHGSSEKQQNVYYVLVKVFVT